jgi:phospholipid-binding lipoprotein MlaA
MISVFSPPTPKVCRVLLATVAAGALSVIAVSASAQTVEGQGAAGAIRDPFEGINRRLFAQEEALDHRLVRPTAMTYRRVLPKWVRGLIADALSNLKEPTVAVNDALQGHGAKAARTVTRFVVNTTIGVAGSVDVARTIGLPRRTNDFGLTMARYGVGAGPYLFLPFVGPTSLRDSFGGIVSMALNPLSYVTFPGLEEIRASAAVAGSLDTRVAAEAELRTLRAAAIDPYASVRAYWTESRAAQVRGGVIDVEALPTFDDPGQMAAIPSTGASAPRH